MDMQEQETKWKGSFLVSFITAAANVQLPSDSLS
jgi:hypothetical protein